MSFFRVSLRVSLKVSLRVSLKCFFKKVFFKKVSFKKVFFKKIFFKIVYLKKFYKSSLRVLFLRDRFLKRYFWKSFFNIFLWEFPTLGHNVFISHQVSFFTYKNDSRRQVCLVLSNCHMLWHHKKVKLIMLIYSIH